MAVIKLCAALPRSESARHIAGQLLRCAISPAPNYGEARAAESKNDFVHKLGIVLKELNESLIWLEMIKRSGLMSADKLESVIRECDELCQIIGASIQTVGKRGSR